MDFSWKYLRTTPLGELVTGTAHQAHPTDVTAPLGVRFANQTVLAIHVALEKAATVRVSFDGTGTPRLTGIRNIRQRNSAEFGEVLRAEVAATNAAWAVIVLATGWQATLGQRSARPESNEAASPFFRHRLMSETPEVVVPRAQVDRAYTAIDHPLLDKSIVFSVRRRELEDLFAELRKCGLGVAAVRLAVAAQLELWFASQGEAGLTHDLLLTDGLSALLINTDQGDFVPPRGVVEGDQPRQSVQRPSAVEEDIVRFVHANAGRAMTYLGPEELVAGIKKAAPDAEIVRPPDHPAHDTQCAALLAPVRHDLNFEAKEVRPALPRSWRRLVVGGGIAALILGAVATFNAIYAARTGIKSYQLERESAELALAAQEDSGKLSRIVAEFGEASTLRAWIAANFHAQPFCQRVLRDIPTNAAIDKLSIELRDGQISLTFVVLGDQETQLAAHRAVEQAIKDLHFKIGGEDLPAGAGVTARAVQYRLFLIVPDAGEVAGV